MFFESFHLKSLIILKSQGESQLTEIKVYLFYFFVVIDLIQNYTELIFCLGKIIVTQRACRGIVASSVQANYSVNSFIAVAQPAIKVQPWLKFTVI